MSVYNKNFIVQSLQGVIPPKSLDHTDLDDSSVQIIAWALNHPDSDLDRSIIGKVWNGYFERRRRQPIGNPSAFIISPIQKALAIRKAIVWQPKHEPLSQKASLSTIGSPNNLAWLTERS